MLKPYARGNRFSVLISVADAAVDWQGLDASQYFAVKLDAEGLPSHPTYPELYDRAEALCIAAEQDIIGGLTHTEDGMPLPPRLMKLKREDVAAFINETDARLAKEPPAPLPSIDFTEQAEKLLTKAEVCELLNISKATLDRRRSESKFPNPTHLNPNRWRSSVVAAYITAQTLTAASAHDPDESEDI